MAVAWLITVARPARATGPEFSWSAWSGLLSALVA